MEFITAILTGTISNVLSQLVTGESKRISKKDIEESVRKVLKTEYNIQDRQEIFNAISELNLRLEKLEVIQINSDEITLKNISNKNEITESIKLFEERKQAEKERLISSIRDFKKNKSNNF